MAGFFHLGGHLALARFEVGETFPVGHPGHIIILWDGRPADPTIGGYCVVRNPSDQRPIQ